MKIYFKTRSVYRENVIIAHPECKRAEALFRLINRNHLKPNELPDVGRLGLEIEIVGDLQQLTTEMREKKIEHQQDKKTGRVIVTPELE